MGMSSVGAAARTASYRLTTVALGIGLAAALALGPGGSFAPAQAAVAGPQPAGGADPLAAWGVTATVPANGSFVLAVDPTTSTVYMGGQGGLSVVNALTGQVTGSITVAGDLVAGAVNPATGTLYVTTEFPGSVVAVDTKSGTVTTTIPDAGSPRGIAVDPETNRIYVTNASTVSVIDGSANTIAATIDISDGLSGIAVDPLTNRIYVSNFNTDAVSVIDGSTNTETATIDVGRTPTRIAVNPATDKIYVVNGQDSTISVINGATNTVTATVDALAQGGIAVDPETDTIYTLDLGGGLAGLDGRTNEFTLGNLFTFNDPANTFGEGLAVDPAAGTVYAMYEINSTDGPDTAAMAIITSCRNHVIAPAGSNCAKLAADFEPDAPSFSSASAGVVVGSPACPLAICEQAAMMATADGGKHWSFLSPPPELEIGSPQQPAARLLFTSPDNGWLYGRFHTSNGGASWQRAVPGDIVLAVAASSTTVYAAVEPFSGRGGLFATPIGAARWTRIPAINQDANGLAAWGHSVWLTSSTHLWATSDGKHWNRYPARCPNAADALAGVTATSSTHIALLCNRPGRTSPKVIKEVLVSTNGGRTVHLAGIAPVNGAPQAFASPPGDPSVITIATASPTGSSTYWLYRSANGGRTWSTLTLHHELGAGFSSLSYGSRNDGWIVLGHALPDAENVLLHTTDGGRTWHKVTL